MTDIDKYLLRFERYWGGEISREEARSFEQDLEVDAEMRKQWQAYWAMMEAFTDKEAISLRVKMNEAYDCYFGKSVVRKLTGNMWFRISAVMLVILIVGSLLNNPGKKKNEEVAGLADDSSLYQKEEMLPDTIAPEMPELSEQSEQVNKIQLASIFDEERYQISPVFAELLHNVYRSGWFRLNSPADSVMFTPGDTLVFSWETNIQSPIYFDVLNRHGHVIYTHPNSIASPWMWAPTLEPAIYMFRFATKNEPVWMGVGVVE